MNAIAFSGHRTRRMNPALTSGLLRSVVVALSMLLLATAARAAAPSITNLDPSSGATGAIVAINGAGFGSTQGSSTVTVNSVAAVIKTWSDTRIVMVIPSGVTTGNVVVTVSGLASNGQTFAVVPPPSISSVSPALGVAGTVVTITGSNFGATQGSLGEVMFNGVPCRCEPPWSNTRIQATVPAGAHTGNLVVAAPGGVISNAVAFSVPPLIRLLSPNAGTVGSSVTITGLAFGPTQGTSTVTFNGVVATPTSWSDTSVVVPVPGGANVGNAVVTVGGLASSGVQFSVIPTITSVSPKSGAAGTPVTITGQGFGASQGSSTVTFNGAAATPTSWSSTSISVPVPSGGSAGNVVITVGGNASNGTSFAVTPVISSLSRSSGAVGASVTISGLGFGNGQGTSTVAFNGTMAPPASWSNTSISVPVPSSATTGNVVVTVGGTASNGTNFTITPAITSLSPASGAAGTSVIITGTSFGASQGSSAVTFNGTAATSASWSDASISVPVPSGATTGNVVVSVAGNASNGTNFTVTPSVSTLSPAAGAVGTPVTITGANFGATQGTSTVTFSGTAATVSSWSNTQIVTAVPTGATSGNLVVAVGGATSNGVNFTVTPGISSLSPASGAVGTSVTITGTNFAATQGSSTIVFNGAPATTTSWSNTQIVALVPNGATTGNVVVTVGGEASNGASFTATLGIGSESPSSGPVGTVVTISGTGFGSLQGTSTVTFNGAPAQAASWSTGSIVVQVPNGATTGNLVVTIGGTASNAMSFTVTSAPVVQSNSGFGAGVTSTSVPFLGSNTVGNLLWVAVGGGGTIMPPTDTLGNAYTFAASASGQGGSGNAAIYYAVSAAAGANTVTCSQSVADDIHCHIAEISGLAAVSPLDQSGSLVSSSCLVSTAGPAAQANEWVGAFFYDSSSDPPLIAGSGYGAMQLSNNATGDAALSESATSSSAGAQTASCGGNATATLLQLITTFETRASVPVPAISSLTPSSGPVGSTVVIAGSNFGAAQGSSTVTFNGVTASATSWSAGSITAVAPAGATTGNVVVTVAGVSSGGAPFTVVPPPSISTLSPSSGPVGSTVVIAGSTFGAAQGGSTITFNGITASVTSWSANSITAVVPAGATSGNVVVTVVGGVSSAGVNYTVLPVPVITSLTPTSGAVQSSVTIAGNNFGTIQGNGTLTFNGTPVTLLTWSNTSITAQVPETATSGNVVVTAAGGVSSAGVSFTVLPAPVIDSLTPTGGGVGTSVTIAGNNFGPTQGTSTVTFNGAIAAARGRIATSWSNTKIVVNVPSGATSGPVVVAVGGKASNPVVFGVSTNIVSLSPPFGPVGALISVNGAGFGGTQGTSTVTFNGMTAPPNNWSDSSIIVPVPVGVTTGNVVVTVGGVASNGVLFTAAPVINSLSASTLPVGASLTISGLNFGASQGASTVTFNGTVAQPTGWSSTQIVVPVPIGATPGNVVVTANGMASNGVNFTPGPFVSALSLTTAAVGTPITITGGNFGTSQGSSTVTFNGTTGTPISWSNTQIVVPAPLGATPGNVVVTVNGLASNGVNFTPGPSLTALNVTSGVTGTTVTLTGVNFGGAQGTSTVTFNGVSATSFPQWTNTQIQAVVPSAGSSGNVVVTVGGFPSNGVVFTVLPNITSLSPANGIVGASVNINGTGFGNSQGASTLTFNGILAIPLSWSTTQIVAQVPSAATTGNVIVTVGGNPSNGVNFAVTPEIGGLSPTSGPVGTEVTINGTTFGATQGTSTVTLNGIAVTPSSWSSTQIVFAVPSGATTGNVVVTVGGTASNPATYTVTQGQAGARSTLTSFVASDGSAHTFYVGPDQHVYHLFWNSTNNWQYQDLTDITASSGASSSALSSFASADGIYHVIYLDGNSHVNQLIWIGGTWFNQDLTGISGATVTAVSNTMLTSLVDAVGEHTYYLATNQHEYQLLWNGSNWANQDLTALSNTTLPLAASGSALTSFALSDGSEHSFYVASNQHIHQMRSVPGTGYFDQDLTYTAALNLAGGACAQQNGTCPVTGTMTVGFGANGSWNFLTVTSNVACNVATFGDPAPGVTKACYYVKPSFPLAATGGALTSFNDTNGDHVYYLDSIGHNHELLLKGDPGSVTAPWIDQDQTTNSGTSVVAVAGSALTSFPTGDNNQHLIYLDTSHHVDQMLYQLSSNAWLNQDLTATSGTSVTAAAGSGLTSFVQSAGNLENVQYLDSNGHINQLGLNSSNAWQNQDLTAIATNAGASVPGIGSLSPTSGPVGAAVTINGVNFGPSQGTNTTVSFNGTLATVTSWSNTQIVVPVPGGATSGNVVVTVNGVASNGVSFAVIPSINSLFPTSGPVGTFVTIAGTAFGTSQGTSKVSFNGVLATPASWTNTQIVVPVPSGATTGNVVVTVGGVASNVGSFAVAPGIVSLSPNSGLIGTQVTISGTTFGSSQGSSTVSFNGTPATVTSWSDTQIMATVPVGATTGNVVVTVGSLASNGAVFTVTNPFITSLSPPSGLAGSPLTINGANFGSSQNGSTVTFGGQQVAPTSWSASAIGITVPGNASLGNNSVTVAVGGITSNAATYVVSSSAPPAISSLTPNSGPVGTSVTIAGSNFGSSQNGSTVTFNGVAASVAAWSSGSITAAVPANATTGPVVVTVAGAPSAGVPFTVFLQPSVASVNPNTGAPGTPITINGANFGTSQGSSTLTFNGVTATAITSWSPTTIVAVVPNGATTGPVVVTTQGGANAGPPQFVVPPAATVNSVSPPMGPGGMGVVVTGSHFGQVLLCGPVPCLPGPQVLIGGVPARILQWVDNGNSGSTLTFQVPEGAVGGFLVVQTAANGAALGPVFTVTNPFGCP